MSKKQSQQVTTEKPKAHRYYSQPGTLSGRLDEIESHFGKALTGIEQELERTPESEKGLRKFLERLQRRAVFGEFKIEDYRCYKLGKEDGTITEAYYEDRGWIEL